MKLFGHFSCRDGRLRRQASMRRIPSRLRRPAPIRYREYGLMQLH